MLVVWKVPTMAAEMPSPAILEACISFHLCGIFGRVTGLIGWFSIGLFLLVLYFIWQWGFTALLEFEFIFFPQLSDASRL